MAISKWNPFGRDSSDEMTNRTERSAEPWRDLQRQMNRMFEDFFNRSALQRTDWSAPTWSGRKSFSPRIDVSEDDETLKIQAELPGLDKDDIELEADENSVTIQGEKSHEEEREEEGFYRNERSYGYFRRTIPFPMEVDTSKAKATFNDGVLDVRFPKRGDSKGKQLEIES